MERQWSNICSVSNIFKYYIIDEKMKTVNEKNPPHLLTLLVGWFCTYYSILTTVFLCFGWRGHMEYFIVTWATHVIWRLASHIHIPSLIWMYDITFCVTTIVTVIVMIDFDRFVEERIYTVNIWRKLKIITMPMRLSLSIIY